MDEGMLWRRPYNKNNTEADLILILIKTKNPEKDLSSVTVTHCTAGVAAVSLQSSLMRVPLSLKSKFLFVLLHYNKLNSTGAKH